MSSNNNLFMSSPEMRNLNPLLLLLFAQLVIVALTLCDVTKGTDRKVSVPHSDIDFWPTCFLSPSKHIEGKIRHQQEAKML